MEKKESVSPTCPKCGASGIDHFVSKESTTRSRYREPWFFVVYCDQCGHVYDVIAKHVFAQTATRVVLPNENTE